MYDVQPQPRTVADVLAALTGRFADPQPGPPRATTARPRARARWLQASLTSTIDQVVADTFAQADRRDPTHRCAWLALFDGNCAMRRSVISPAEQGEIGGISLDPMANPEPKGNDWGP